MSVNDVARKHVYKLSASKILSVFDGEAELAATYRSLGDWRRGGELELRLIDVKHRMEFLHDGVSLVAFQERSGVEIPDNLVAIREQIAHCLAQSLERLATGTLTEVR